LKEKVVFHFSLSLSGLKLTPHHLLLLPKARFGGERRKLNLHALAHTHFYTHSNSPLYALSRTPTYIHSLSLSLRRTQALSRTRIYTHTLFLSLKQTKVAHTQINALSQSTDKKRLDTFFHDLKSGRKQFIIFMSNIFLVLMVLMVNWLTINLPLSQIY